MINDLNKTISSTKQDQWRSKYGSWAVITGASDGIGRAFAYAIAKMGLNIVLVARRRTNLDQLAETLSHMYKVKTTVIAADLSQDSDVQRVIEETIPLDVGLLVACAGYGTSGCFTDSDSEVELNLLTVNCRAVLMMSHHYGRRFAQQKHGGIILMGSLLGFQGVPMSANYAATKAYIQSLAEGLHLELAPFGVDVISSAPGPTQSGFAERAKIKMGMTDKPETVAKSTLASLGRKLTIRPGAVSKLLGYSLGMLPRKLRTRILGRIMQGMVHTTHHKETR